MQDQIKVNWRSGKDISRRGWRSWVFSAAMGRLEALPMLCNNHMGDWEAEGEEDGSDLKSQQ